MKYMKAIVYDKHASPDGLKCIEIDKPVPGEDEVLIRVGAASVNPLDYHLLRHPMIRRVMTLMSKQKTTRPGRDLAGEVEAVGASVTQFAVGDEVFGVALGAFAEYAVTSESRLAAKPDNMSFAEAAAVPVAGLTALQGLRDLLLAGLDRALGHLHQHGVDAGARSHLRHARAHLPAPDHGNATNFHWIAPLRV